MSRPSYLGNITVYPLSVACQRAWVGSSEVTLRAAVGFGLGAVIENNESYTQQDHLNRTLTAFGCGFRRCSFGGFQKYSLDRDNGACYRKGELEKAKAKGRRIDLQFILIVRMNPHVPRQVCPIRDNCMTYGTGSSHVGLVWPSILLFRTSICLKFEQKKLKLRLTRVFARGM